MNSNWNGKTRRVLGHPLVQVFVLGFLSAVIYEIPAQWGPPSADDTDVAVESNEFPDGPPAHPGFGPRRGPQGRPGAAMAGGRGAFAGLRRDVRQGVMGAIGHLSIPYVLSPDVREKIVLTDDQIETLEDRQYAHRRATIELEADTELAELELGRLVQADRRPDRDKVLSQVEAIGKLRTERQKLDVENLLALRETLTDEQVAQVRQLARDRRDERRDQFQPGRQGFGPGRPDAAVNGFRGRQGDRPGPQRADRPDFGGRGGRDGNDNDRGPRRNAPGGERSRPEAE
jgi:Spy/CpxP family protein refolding chaperone